MISRNQIEFAGVVVAYIALYFLVLDPIVVAVSPFDAAPWDPSGTTRGSHIDEILTSVRGWLFILGFFPSTFAYYWVRTRMFGKSDSDSQ